MADFSSVSGIMSNIRSADDILRIFKNIYSACIEVEAILARYNTDAAFKAEADHLFTPTQIAELGDMITDIQGLQQDWLDNHTGPLGLGTPM
jgi:hypothetical protein